jgi:signal transduction histidine kinase
MDSEKQDNHRPSAARLLSVPLAPRLAAAAIERRTPQGTAVVNAISQDRRADSVEHAQEALRDLYQFAQATLDALSSHIAVLDETGTILRVNTAWRRFAHTNASLPSKVAEGTNYLTVCDTAVGEGQDEARAVAQGIRAVLSGEQKTFSLEYSCLAESAPHVFRVTVTCFFYGGAPCAVVAHEDITKWQQAELIARGQTEVLEQTLTRLANEPTVKTFLGHVLHAITEQLHAPSSALYLYNEDTQTLILRTLLHEGRVSLGGFWPRDPVASLSWPVDKQDPAWRALTIDRMTFVVQDVPNNPRLPADFRAWAKDAGIKTNLLVPLIAGKRFVGILTVRSLEDRQFRAEEKELAQALAHQATMAIELTRLAEQARQAAVFAERNRMAREIHDTLAQGFTGILLQMEAAKATLQSYTHKVIPYLRMRIRLQKRAWLKHGDLFVRCVPPSWKRAISSRRYLSW